MLPTPSEREENKTPVLPNLAVRGESRMTALEYTAFLHEQRNRLGIISSQDREQGVSKLRQNGVLTDYSIGKELGKGAYATVKQGTHKTTRAKVALKTYEKYKLFDPQRKQNVAREIQILRKLDHPNIVRFVDKIEVPRQLHLVMECVQGQSLQAYLKQKKKLTEEECKPIFLEILKAISYCHAQNIAHRDIKLDNIILSNGLIPKIIDFGFSTCVERKTKMFCGTPSYMAPEIVTRKEYRGICADVWALGILLFVLLCGYFPFKGLNDRDLFKKIEVGKFVYPKHLSEEVKHLLNRVLVLEPDRRLTVDQILQDEWLREDY